MMPEPREFEDLFQQLRASDESVEIEAKRGSAAGKSIQETLCAMANEPGRGGGYLLLGVVEDGDNLFDGDYRVEGVQEMDRVQTELSSLARGQAFSHPIQVQLDAAVFEGKNVLVVRVGEAAEQHKPIYLSRLGLPEGAFRRIGAADERMTPDDLLLFHEGRANRTHDEAPVVGSGVEHVDPAALELYRDRLAQREPSAEALRWSDEELLDALSATTRHGGKLCLTVAGMMLFGSIRAQRKFLPLTKLDYIKVPGNTWVADPDQRYESTVPMRGPLLSVIPSMVATILGDVQRPWKMEGVHRDDSPVLPQKVVREALVNAVMHRTYQKHSPVQIIRYQNRIEILNAGHSLKARERLGEPKSETRNPKLAAVLEEVGLAEAKGTGIRTMRRLLQEASLTQPLFDSDRVADEFRVTLWVVNLMGPEDRAWLAQYGEWNLKESEARGLIYLRDTGRIDNATYREINAVDTLKASAELQRLRQAKLLVAQGSGSKVFYRAGPGMQPGSASGAAVGRSDGMSGPGKPDRHGMSGSEKPDMPSNDARKRGHPPADPEEAIQEAADRLGLPPVPTSVLAAANEGALPKIERRERLLVELCGWRPFSSAELAELIDMNGRHLTNQYLTPMIRRGVLRYGQPDNPRAPGQTYKASPKTL